MADRGLTEAEATARLVEHGRNAVFTGPERSALFQLVARFKNPLILLLVAASAVSAATGDAASAVVIVVMVAMSAVLDFIQERRAGKAAERLKEGAALRATVIRDGNERDLPVEEIVPGDVIKLCAGDVVPADGVVLEARDLFVNQALLTGEPYPVEKRAAAAGDDGRVFMGASVISGSATARVDVTGARTRVGQVGVSLTRTPPPTSFEVGTRQFGLLIVRLALVMVLFVLFVNLVRERPWLESFLFAIALAVGLTPELLPMVVSVTLARGAVRMSKKKVLTKRLAAIHDLGSMDVLCTDKTGTLTEARIRLEKLLDAAGDESPRVLELAVLNSAFESGIKSPLDDAILRHDHIDISAWTKIDEVPFDFERRRVSVLVERAGDPSPLLIVKGAFEDVLRLATVVEDAAGGLTPIDPGRRRELAARFRDLGREGYRVLGIAWKREAGAKHALVTDETELVFAGFAAFEDPPKQSAAAALSAMKAAGVSVVIVTGDHELVAEHVCKELGVAVTGIVTGEDLDRMDGQALDASVERANLFCRVNPMHKNRVILALKRRGHVVGFLGDGVNDATALHSADVGISVDSAVDVAKEAADLILLEHDLGVLREGIVEGRRTIGNIIKYIMMGTSSNFGNMFSMAGASLFLPFLPMLPLQVLVNNFLYDLSELPIPTDSVDDEYIARPHRWDMSFIRRFMIVMGPVSSIFDFATFGLLYFVFARDEALFHTGWFIESLATQVLVIFVIRTGGNPLRARPSRALALTSVAVVVFGVLLTMSPLAGDLGFVAPPPLFFAVLTPLVGAYLLAAQVVKRAFYRRLVRQPAPPSKASARKVMRARRVARSWSR